MERVQAAFLAKTGQALAAPIEKVRKFSDLPTMLQNAVHAQNAGNAPQGALFDSKFYVMKESHTPAAVLDSIVFHGLYDHTGIGAPVGGPGGFRLLLGARHGFCRGDCGLQENQCHASRFVRSKTSPRLKRGDL